MPSDIVATLLLRQKLLDADKLQEAQATAKDKGMPLRDVLLGLRWVEEGPLTQALCQELGLSYAARVAVDEVPESLVAAVPINFARQHRILPFAFQAGVVQVALADPLDLQPLDDLRALLRQPVAAVGVPGEAIDDAINRVYERKDETALAEAREGEEVEELQDLIDMTDEAPVIRWVNNLFYNAVRDRASDIHIEPTDNEVVVRCRVDGKLVPTKTAHRGFLPSIVARVKIEAGLNIAEKRLPQDGRITKKIAGKLVDVRVSTIPTAKGERVVMRLLDKEQVLLDLQTLGFDGQRLRTMHHLIGRPNGILLVTGPTGSGKTTTLYACLHQINRPEVNILTVEDPVEYELRGVGQMQIQPKIGLTFASGLRSFLRQDPDVIMVGEIRDHETAEIAVHASLTGHLVLSTLHTNDAPSAVTRLSEMGVQPFLIASSLLAVLAQRLVRRLCPRCREPYSATAEDLRSLGLDDARLRSLYEEAAQRAAEAAVTQVARPGARRPSADVPMAAPDVPTAAAHAADELDPAALARAHADAAAVAVAETARQMPRSHGQMPVFYRARGCEDCGHTGYRGRLGIHELMVVDEPVRREILNQSDATTMMRVACQRGMRTLREDGARHVVAGVTSVEEVLAATQAGDLESGA
ncbi:MAG: GspE/PulE family protein [Polyangiales bacterium]